MKPVLLTILFVFSIQLTHSQINAITESGDEVILHEDGTWSYLNDSILKENNISLNEKEYLKEKKSTFLVKSKKTNTGIWINPKEWKFTKSINNEDAEFQFQKKDEDLYAILISEKIEIPVESLMDIAVDNARSAAPDIKVTHKEYRSVNGIQVLMMQMSGTVQGIKITYFGYYFSSPGGTIQLLSFTGESLFDDYFSDIEKFMNGFIVLDDI
jgi:hypothetical protein